MFVTSDVLLSVAMGDLGRMYGSLAESQSAVSALSLLPGTTNVITADYVSAESFATCGGFWGSSEITNLQVGGLPIAVSGQSNQTVNVPGVLTLVINEQVVGANGITVNALDLTTLAGTKVIVSSASSTLSCA
jgi:hypothetical protein